MKEKINNRITHLLTIKEINYMYEILNSELEEKDKIAKLYSTCNYSNVCNSLAYCKLKNSDSREVKMLTIIKKFYEDKFSKEHMQKNTKCYRCSLEEMELRLDKIVEALSIIRSNEKEYEKAYKLYNLYKSSQEFKRSYTFFIKYGEDDSRLEYAREALNNLDNIYNKYVEYENNGIMQDIVYFNRVKDYFINYNYAKFILDYYVESPNSYRDNILLPELGIDKKIFEFCAKTIEELDCNLYKEYLDKREINKKIRFIKNKVTIQELAVGIRTGFLPNGEKFDTLEFIKKTPFKGKDFANIIAEFMKTSHMPEFEIVMNYINNNKLHLPSTFKEIDINELYNIKIIVGNRELTKEDIDYIIEYLNLNNIIITNKTFTLARNKYLNGEINIEEIKKSNKKEFKERILIPTIRK